MKTTIDIADDLFGRVQRMARQEKTTFRSLTEEGLRHFVGCSHDEQLKEQAKQPLLVQDVETVPNYCSCGLGNEKTFPVIMHPEGKCHLRRRHEMLHNQSVTIELGGYKRKSTGYYLEHV